MKLLQIGKSLGRGLKHRIKLNHREGQIAIIGCGRSGTTYTSQLFKAFGYSIGHESLERHGISSWCLVPDTAERCWGPTSQELRRLRIPRVHQVRHPLNVIASISTATERSWQFIANFIPIDADDSITLKGMKYWLYWNQLAETRAELTYRVEDIDSVLPDLFQIARFNESCSDTRLISKVPKNINRRDHGSLTWQAIEAEDASMTKQIRELATRYGYTL